MAALPASGSMPASAEYPRSRAAARKPPVVLPSSMIGVSWESPWASRKAATWAKRAASWGGSVAWVVYLERRA